MSEHGEYSPEEALDEAEKKKKLLDSGGAVDYAAASAVVGQSEKNPKDLLLTPAETADIAFTDRYTYEAESGGQRVFVLGTKHTNELTEIQDFVSILEKHDPDLVLTEVANGLEAYYPSMTWDEIMAMKPEDVIKGQEQMYFTWLAAKKGKQVGSWDIPQTEIIKRTINKDGENGPRRYSEDDAMAWLATYGMRKLYEDCKINKLDTVDDLYTELYKLITYACPGIEKDNDINITLTKDSLDKILVAATNQSLADYVRRARNQDDYEADKYLVTQTSNNSFSRDMNIQRDRHAIDTIQKAKKDGDKRIFVTAGGSHAVVWEKAIKQIYKPT